MSSIGSICSMQQICRRDGWNIDAASTVPTDDLACPVIWRIKGHCGIFGQWSGCHINHLEIDHIIAVLRKERDAMTFAKVLVGDDLLDEANLRAHSFAGANENALDGCDRFHVIRMGFAGFFFTQWRGLYLLGFAGLFRVVKARQHNSRLFLRNLAVLEHFKDVLNECSLVNWCHICNLCFC